MQFTNLSRALIFVLILVTAFVGASAQRGSKALWTEIPPAQADNGLAEINSRPGAYRVFRMNRPAMESLLIDAPEEFSALADLSQQVITLPMPDGSMGRFRIEHSLVVEPGLAAKYPELGRTYRGRGIDDPTASVRLDFLSSGFHSMILSRGGTVLVDPIEPGQSENYISYFKRDAKEISSFSCSFDEKDEIDSMFSVRDLEKKAFIVDSAADAPAFASGAQLRTYRLALAATGEYTAAVGGGTVAGSLAAQVLIMNRVNGVYEREVAIRMVIVANNDQIVYTTASTDPYTNSDGEAMLDENMANLNSVIGTANYDIGHVFSTGGGGIAELQGPCGTRKAGGVTGLPNPVGDAFAIDYVAHEMGHQWGAPHTFNGTSGSCSGNRNSSSAFEPGSGITIMAYAGICSGQNLAAHSVDTFHAKSLQDIINYTQTGNGNTCAVASATGNSPPNISLPNGQSFNIPMQTPFVLEAVATDPDGDAVSYDWQQYDLGPSTTAVPNTDSDGNARPIFRVYPPVSQSSRFFPSLAYILGNENVPPSKTGNYLTGELLPSIARTMNFRVVVRDNRAGGGGVASANESVIVSGTSGPFKITSPNTAETWNTGQSRTLTWDVAGTSAPPVNTANVRITLSLDGGQTFPIVLVSSTPNDGTQSLTVPPAVNTSQARVKIEAEGNIYFDINDTNFNISASPAASGSISGRVTNAAGLGLSKVVVVLSGPLGTSTAVTNGFGFYQFDDQPFSSNYTVKPLSRKHYVFTPFSSSFTLASSLSDMNFTGHLN